MLNQFSSCLYFSFSTKCCGFALPKLMCGRKETVRKVGNMEEQVLGAGQDFFTNCTAGGSLSENRTTNIRH